MIKINKYSKRLYIYSNTLYNVFIESNNEKEFKMSLAILAKTNPEKVSRNDILNIFGCENRELPSVIANLVNNCDDIELLKSVALSHDGYEYAHSLEDKMVELMGDDAYWDFISENNL